MRREIQTFVSLTAHEPERLAQAAQQMADANARELDRLNRIIRGRELRRALRSELKGEHESATALRASFTHLLQQIQETYSTEAFPMTMPHKARARNTIFLLKLENEGLGRAAAASLASITTARAGRRFLDPSLRPVIVGALARIDARLAQLVHFCAEVQKLAVTDHPAPDGDGADEDDL
jgi:exonuclease VII large subunit